MNIANTYKLKYRSFPVRHVKTRESKYRNYIVACVTLKQVLSLKSSSLCAVLLGAVFACQSDLPLRDAAERGAGSPVYIGPNRKSITACLA